jgi:hypothetical protein
MRSICVSLGILLSCCVLPGQDPRGSIVGRVSDASGAVVPGAKVDVSNPAMGTKTTLTSNESGFYQATFLSPGRYEVTAEAPGFKKSVREEIEVRIGDRLELDIRLEVGSPDQSVTVTGETPLLETGTASMGAVVDGRRIAEMPIPHGNPYFLIGLAPGVTFARDPRLDRPHEPTHIVGYSMDGTRANRSDVTIDGLPSTSTANAYEVTASFVPPADIVAEFKVQTATFDAQFGQTEGGVTNISVKSGTNLPHGTLYYTNMTPGLFANDWFANANRIPRADFYYHRFGSSLGGPVMLPKLYDGRNRTFFLWGYEGIIEGRPRNNSSAPTVPTDKMKNGDFSDLLAVSPNYQIYNPFTRVVEGARYRAQPFPGNIIPPSLFSPVGRKILEFFPRPLQAGNADGTNNYLRPEMQEVIDYHSHTIRLDQVVSDKQRLFARVSWYDRAAAYNNYFNNLATGTKFGFESRAAVLDDVYVLSPTTVLNVRYGYNRFIRLDRPNPESWGFDLTTLGFPAAYNNAIPAEIRSFPQINMTGYQGTGFGNDYRPTDIHALSGTVQKTVHQHFLKTGVEFRAYREQSIPTGRDQTGTFNFDTTWTRGPLDNSPGSPGGIGQSVAALLLGLPSGNSLVNRNASYAEQSTSWGFFFQDDWKASSRLTLNLGLRWEFETALTERYNRSVRGMDPAVVQSFSAQAQAAYAQNPTPEVPASQFALRGGLLFPGVGGLGRGAYDTPKRNLMPRVGLTYALTPRTVIRSGYGIFYGFLGQRRGDVVLHGFSRTTSFLPTLDNINFIGTLSNPFPTGILEPLGSAQGPLTFVGQSVNVYHPRPLMPYMQRWEFGIQHELRGFLLELGYVGNRGTHIQIVRNLNATPIQYLSTSPARDTAAINYLSANLPNPMRGLLPAGASASLIGNTIARERLLRPFPHFDAVRSEQFDGYSWYHSLQARLEKRFASGYMLHANYTYSKFMQATELLNQTDPRPTEVISDMDFRHRLAISSLYELPFGKNQRLLASAHPVASAMVSGWQINGVYTLQSGAPITFSANPSNLQFGAIGNPTGIIFNGSFNDIPRASDQRSVYRWFNTSGFVTNSAQQLDLGRQIRTFPLRLGNVRGNQGNQFDLSALKNTRIGESMNVQFKAEFLNALNHPVFPLPTGNAVNPANINFAGVTVTNQANYPRRIQLTLKFLF